MSSDGVDLCSVYCSSFQLVTAYVAHQSYLKLRSDDRFLSSVAVNIDEKSYLLSALIYFPILYSCIYTCEPSQEFFFPFFLQYTYVMGESVALISFEQFCIHIIITFGNVKSS